ncbi:MAG: metal-dependent hydrolase, partial [Desulfobacterales bacterium]
MQPITHFLASWTVASIPRLESRDRIIITLAGISPDVDGVGLVVELATEHTQQPLLWWSKYHHVIGHNLIFGIVISLTAAAIAKRRLLTAALV